MFNTYLSFPITGSSLHYILRSHIETCDNELSFHESKQTVPAVNAISTDFLCMNFNVKKDGLFFSRNICQALVFLCVHMY